MEEKSMAKSNGTPSKLTLIPQNNKESKRRPRNSGARTKPSTSSGPKSGSSSQSISQTDFSAHESGQNTNQSNYDLEELLSNFDFYHDQNQQPCARCFVDGVQTVHFVESKRFLDLLFSIHFDNTHSALPDKTRKAAKNIARHHAITNIKQENNYLRFANLEGIIYIDLCDGKGSVVVVSSDGHQVVTNPPVNFVRHPHMLPLPYPNAKAKGDLDLLFDMLRVSKKDRLLLTAWIVSAFDDSIPRPILMLFGEPGSSKSTLAKYIRKMIDPSTGNLIHLSTSNRSLAATLLHHAVPAFDNIDVLRKTKSDLFCSAVTGTSISERKLQTNSDTAMICLKKSIIFTSIDVPTTAEDLIDRSILLEMPRISGFDRSKEQLLDVEFERNYTELFTSVLLLLSKSLQLKGTFPLKTNIRMADWAGMAGACALALEQNPQDLVSEITLRRLNNPNIELPDRVFILRITDYIRSKQKIDGTVTSVLQGFKEYAKTHFKDENGVPSAANVFSRKLRKYLPFFEQLGIRVTLSSTAKDARYILIELV